MVLTLLAGSISLGETVKCDRNAEEATRAVYAVSDKAANPVTMVQYVGSDTDFALGEQKKIYKVILDVNGGSGQYLVEAIPALGCLVSRVQLQHMD